MTFRSDGKATLRSPLPDEVAFESLASRLRPFTVDTDDLFYGKAFDALDRLLAAPKHGKFRRISQAVHQDWRTATDRTSRTRAYRISSEAAQHRSTYRRRFGLLLAVRRPGPTRLAGVQRYKCCHMRRDPPRSTDPVGP